MKMNDNKINFKTPRTIVGTVMEIAVGILVLVLWVLIIYLSVNATSDTVRLLVVHGIYSTILPPLMMGLCYYPRLFNIPTRNPRAEHYLLTIQLVRIVSILVMLMMIVEAWDIGRPDDARMIGGAETVLGCIITVTVVCYIIRLLRMR